MAERLSAEQIKKLQELATLGQKKRKEHAEIMQLNNLSRMALETKISWLASNKVRFCEFYTNLQVFYK